MPTFPFVPRKVAKALRPEAAQPDPPLPASASASHDSEPVAAASGVTAVTGEGNSKDVEHERRSRSHTTDEDAVALASLALSDYALWSSPSLRHRLESNDDGFVSINDLLRLSPALSGLRDVKGAHVLIAKAIRADTTATLEVRMSLFSPLYSALGSTDHHDVGGYEIRRQTQSDPSSSHYTQAHWDARTVYLENIPSTHRTVPRIARFVCALLASATAISTPAFRVQHVHLPSHHHDKPGDPAQCKGFALVTLTTTEDVEALLRDWPWDLRHTPLREHSVAMALGTEYDEAVKFGLRALSMCQWNELQGEYLAYHQRLLDQIRYDSSKEPPGASIITHSASGTARPVVDPLQSSSSQVLDELHAPGQTMASLYPPDCLLFIRNVHIGTNKTTLRALFSRAFPENSSNGIDYVDYTKGMDSCHIRVTSPAHAHLVRDHFAAHPCTQADGLDDQGMHGEGAAVTVEVVQGRKADLYWQKVPEKIRLQAIQRAVESVGSGEAPRCEAGVNVGDDGKEKQTRSRKRKKVG